MNHFFLQRGRKEKTALPTFLQKSLRVSPFFTFDMDRCLIMPHTSYFSPTIVLAEDMNPLFNEIRDLEFNIIKYDTEDENYFEIGDGNIPDFRKLWSPRTDLNRQKVD
jgi:hypothetical protein